METPKQHGARLRALREKAGLTVQELADRAGVHFNSIYRLENGGRRIGLAMIHALAEALRCPPAALMPDGKNGRRPGRR
jgi:transcriptional regulator with XRE-family HTH domain